MITYVIHNLSTGEIDDDCFLCGIVSTSNENEIETLNLPVNHKATELKGDDRYKIVEIDQTKGKPKYKISSITGKPVISNL